MTILIAGTLSIDPSKVDAALADAAEMMTASRAEEGCHAYAFSADPIKPGTLLLFEKWESEDALAAHAASAHMKAFQPKMGGWGITGADIKKYEIASEGPLR
jgi:quinol monooxygenase YgiN